MKNKANKVIQMADKLVKLSSYAEDSFRSWTSGRGIFPSEEPTYRRAFEQSYLGLRNTGVDERSSIDAALMGLHLKPAEHEEPRRSRILRYGVPLLGVAAVALVGFGKQLHVTPWDVYSQFNKPQPTQTEPAPTETPVYGPVLPPTPDNTPTSQSND